MTTDKGNNHSQVITQIKQGGTVYSLQFPLLKLAKPLAAHLSLAASFLVFDSAFP